MEVVKNAVHTSFLFGNNRKKSWRVLSFTRTGGNFLPTTLVRRPPLCEHGAGVGDFKRQCGLHFHLLEEDVLHSQEEGKTQSDDLLNVHADHSTEIVTPLMRERLI